jgi:hypothetical protein
MKICPHPVFKTGGVRDLSGEVGLFNHAENKTIVSRS